MNYIFSGIAVPSPVSLSYNQRVRIPELQCYVIWGVWHVADFGIRALVVYTVCLPRGPLRLTKVSDVVTRARTTAAFWSIWNWRIAKVCSLNLRESKQGRMVGFYKDSVSLENCRERFFVIATLRMTRSWHMPLGSFDVYTATKLVDKSSDFEHRLG